MEVQFASSVQCEKLAPDSRICINVDVALSLTDDPHHLPREVCKLLTGKPLSQPMEKELGDGVE